MKKIILIGSLLLLTLTTIAQKHYISEKYIISDQMYHSIDTLEAYIDIEFKNNIATIWFNDRVDEEVRITKIDGNCYSGPSLMDNEWVSFTIHNDCIIYYCDLAEDRRDYYYALKFLIKEDKLTIK